MPRKPRHKPPQAPAILEPSEPLDHAEPTYIVEYTGNRVAPERKATIYSCADHAKMGPTEIARRLQMDVRTVNAVLANRDADAIEARNYLSAHVLQAAEDWVTASKEGAKKGKHAPAKDLLLHTKVIEPIQDTATVTQIAIVVGAPGQPISLTPPQVIDTSVVSDT